MENRFFQKNLVFFYFFLFVGFEDLDKKTLKTGLFFYFLDFLIGDFERLKTCKTVCVCVCVYAILFVCMYMYTYMLMLMYTCMSVHVYMLIVYIYTCTYTHKQEFVARRRVRAG